MAIKRQVRPSTPGEILKELFMEERGITITALAESMGLTRKHISGIVNGRVAVTADTATKLARVFGTTPQLWLNLQNAVDVFDSQQRLKKWKPARVYLPDGVHA